MKKGLKLITILVAVCMMLTALPSTSLSVKAESNGANKISKSGVEYEKVYLVSKKLNCMGEDVEQEECYEYDEYGNVIYYKHVRDWGFGTITTSIDKSDNTYDEKGRLIKQNVEEIRTSYIDGQLYTSTTGEILYRYDESDRIVYNKQFYNHVSATGSTFQEGYEYTYEFDQYGNRTYGLSKHYHSSYGDVWHTEYEGTISYEYEIDAKGQMIKKKDDSGDWTEYEYNDSGILTKVTNFGKDGSMSSYRIYDDEGRLTEETSITWRDENNVAYSRDLKRYQYDENGNMSAEVWLEHDLRTDAIAITKRQVRQYDSNNKMVRQETYGNDSIIDEVGLYEYDKNGNLIKESYYDANGELDDYTEYEYDEFGNMLKDAFYNGNGELLRNYRYKYVVIDKIVITDEVELSLVSNPESQAVNENEKATFAVEATGNDLTYQWQYKLPNSDEWKDSGMTGSNTNSITVQGTVARNGYQYRCVITDESGKTLTSDAATLTVKINFEITGHPTSKTVEEGKNATFAVLAKGTGLKYQWQYKLPSSSEWKNSGMTGSNTNSITVQGTASRNGYQYRCIITDGSGTKHTTNAATLTVKPSMAITSQPANKTVEVGEKATFAVSATGNGLKYQWQYRTNANATWKVSGMTGAKTNSITVEGTTARNGYQYRCVVTDASGNRIDSNAATLTVKEPAIKFAITTQPASKEVELNENATFKVVATGDGLTYQWQYRTSSATEWKKSGMTGSTTSSITVQGTTARHGYQYRCVVKDANGKQLVSNAATLTVKQSSANAFAITSQPANHTVTEGTKVTFSVAATGEGLKYQWQYRTSATAAWKNSGMTGATTNSISVEATAARNGYQYRCVVFDGTGARIDSNPGSLTVTAGQTNKLAITSQPESKTVALNENATYTVVAEGEGLTYQWQYRTSATAEWKKSGMTGSTTNSITVQGTTARNGYQYRCVVKDANGKQVVSSAADLVVK